MPRIIYNLLLLQATLKANIAGHEVSTVVSTSDLSTTEGKILHRLTARAIISDWEDGVLSPDRTDHEVHSGLSFECITKNNFLIPQPKHMLWVLKRTVSMRQFF